MSDTEIINNIDSNRELINYLLQKKSCSILSASDKNNLRILQENLNRLNALQSSRNSSSVKRIRTIKK